MKIIQPPRRFKEKLKIMPGNYLAPLLFLIILFTVGTVVFLSQAASETELLQEELAEYIAPPVTIGDKLYIITNSHVSYKNKPVSFLKRREILRIARYSILNRLDPIFALEGVDPNTLEKVLASLESSRNDLAALYPPEEQQVLERALFPNNYLHVLPTLEQKRQALISYPSKKIAEEYNALLEETLNAYLSEIQILKEVYQKFSDDERINRIFFHFLGGYSTVEGFVEALTSLEQSALVRKDQAVKRIGCFSKSKPCPLSLDTSSLKINQQNAQETTDKLSREMQIIRDIFLTYHGTTHDVNNEARKNPSIILDESACSYTGKSAYHVFWRTTNEGNYGLQLESLDDLYFFDTRKIDVVYGPYLSNLKEQGVDLSYQTQMNEYMCPDLGKDIAKTSTLFAVHASLKETPLFSTNISALNNAEELKRLEIEIIGNNLLRESTVHSYISKLSFLLLEYGESKLGEILGNENVLRIEKLLSLFHQNSAYYSEILSHIVWTDRNAFSRISKDGEISPIEELLISRGYPQIFFLGSNKSVITKSEPSFMYRNQNNSETLESLRFTTYNRDLRHIMSPNKIIDLMVKNYELRRETVLPRQI